MEIVKEDNRLIPPFMGAKLVENKSLHGILMWTGYKPIEGKLDMPENIRFDKDFKLLEPVLTKIAEDNHIYCFYMNGWIVTINNYSIREQSFIEAAWKSVINFLKQNKDENNSKINDQGISEFQEDC